MKTSLSDDIFDGKCIKVVIMEKPRVLRFNECVDKINWGTYYTKHMFHISLLTEGKKNKHKNINEKKNASAKSNIGMSYTRCQSVCFPFLNCGYESLEVMRADMK